MVHLRLPDFFHILGQLIEAHAPIVKIILPHRRMIAEADLAQPQGQSLRRVGRRLAGGMAAERGVHVVIGDARRVHGAVFQAAPPRARLRTTAAVERALFKV